MSGKRRAETQLNSDNWDEEDEAEDVGEFKKASEETLKARVIKTAKRRITNVGSDKDDKSIFSGFTGFATNRESKSSFSFLSNDLKRTNSDTQNSTKSTFVFSAGSSFNTTKSGLETSNNINNFDSVSSASNVTQKSNSEANVISKEKSTSSFLNSDVAVTSSPFKLFGKSNTTVNDVDDTSNLTNKAKLNKLCSELEKTASEKHSEGMFDSKDDKSEKSPDDIFLQKLRSLNLLCAEWIIKHLNENLSYILTPIFDDYKKHLDQLREERRNATGIKKLKTNDADTKQNAEPVSMQFAFKAPDFKSSLNKLNFGSSLCNSNFNDKNEKSSNFKFPSFSSVKDTDYLKSSVSEKKEDDKKSTISEESKPDNCSFAKQIQFSGDNQESKSTFFSLNSNSSSLGNPFFSQIASTKPSETSSEDTEELPPKQQDVNITEDGAVYEKKCKVYFKKNGNFVDHGVGFLFVKLVGDEQKCQVIVRANNQLANVIVNTLLNSSIPVQKTGKNNVMIICCPTPESQPTSILLKVKTAEDAEELLNVLKKYMK